MNGAALVAIAATVGNFLQGWDNATIAGSCSLFILKSESSSVLSSVWRFGNPFSLNYCSMVVNA